MPLNAFVGAYRNKHALAVQLNIASRRHTPGIKRPALRQWLWYAGRGKSVSVSQSCLGAAGKVSRSAPGGDQAAASRLFERPRAEVAAPIHALASAMKE